MDKNNKSPFTTEDYNSGDGMMTSVWGPALWLSLHTISFNYPINPSEEQKKHYYKYFKSLQNVLPCRFCRENLTKNLKKHKLTYETMKNRESLSRWVYELHELINKLLNKTSGLSYEDVRDRYEHFRSRCLIERKNQTQTQNKEKGCTEPLYGVKSKCVINIVPRDDRLASFKMDPKCVIRK